MTSGRSYSLAFALLSCAALLATGCGSRSNLAGRSGRPAPPDGGPILADLGPDSGDPDLGPTFLEVDCGRHERYTSPRRPLALTAEITASARVESREWTMTSAPAGASEVRLHSSPGSGTSANRYSHRVTASPQAPRRAPGGERAGSPRHP